MSSYHDIPWLRPGGCFFIIYHLHLRSIRATFFLITFLRGTLNDSYGRRPFIIIIFYRLRRRFFAIVDFKIPCPSLCHCLNSWPSDTISHHFEHRNKRNTY
jgi:hypothetical protein